MAYDISISHSFKKQGIGYFERRVPRELESHQADEHGQACCLVLGERCMARMGGSFARDFSVDLSDA